MWRLWEAVIIQKKRLKAMVLRGPMAGNSVLAPILYTTDDTGDIPFVEGFKVTRSNRNTIVVSVKGKEGCGLYSLSGQLYLF